MSNLFKKVTSVLAALAVVTSTVAPISGVSAATSSELEAANSLAAQGIIVDKSANPTDYRLSDTITRGEIAKVMMLLSDVEVSTSYVCQGKFADVSSTNPNTWVCKYVEIGLENGFVASNAKFRPQDNISKAEALKMVMQPLGLAKKDGVEPWEKAYVDAAVEAGILGTAFTDYSANAKRGWIFSLANNGLEYISGDTDTDTDTDLGGIDLGDLLDDLLGGDTGTDTGTSTGTTSTGTTSTGTTSTGTTSTGTTSTGTTSTTGVLEISLAAGSDYSKFVPGVGSHIEVAEVELMASGKDVEITSLVVKRNGLSSNQTVSSIYVEDENGMVLTNQRGLSNDDTANLVFVGGVYKIPAGTTQTVKVVVDLDNTANPGTQTFQFSMESVEANVKVTGTPVVGGMIQTTSYASQILKVGGGLATKAEAEASTTLLYVGDEDKELAKINLDLASNNSKDGIIKTIRLKNRRNVDEYFDNLKLVSGSEVISVNVTRTGKYAIFDLGDGYRVPYGSTKTLRVYGDIIGGEAGDLVAFYFDEPSDIVSMEDKTGAALNVDMTGGVYFKAYKIEEGKNLITKASNSPSSRYIPNDETDILVLSTNVSISNALNVEKIKVPFDGDGVVIRNARLVIDGTVVDTDSSRTNLEATTPYALFNVYKDLKGTHKIEVYIDTQSSISSGTMEGKTVSNFKLNGTGFAAGDLTFVNTGNDASASDIDGEAKSPTFTVRKPAVESIVRTDGYSSEEIIAGVQNKTVMKFSLQANTSRDLVVNNFTVTGTNTGVDKNNVSNLQVVVGGNVIDTDNFSDATATFSSLGIDVEAGKTVEIELRANIASSYTGANLQLTATFSNGDVEDSKGNNAELPTLASVTSDLLVIEDSGIIEVKRDGNSPTTSVLAASTTTQSEVARYYLKATDDDIKVQELTLALLNSTGATDWTGAYNSGYIITDANINSVINKVHLYNGAGTELASASLQNGLVYFDLQNKLIVEKDTEEVIIVKVVTNNIGNLEMDNNAFTFGVLKGTVPDTTKKTKFISEANGEEISGDNVVTSELVSNAQYIRKTHLNVSGFSATSSKMTYKLSTQNDKSATLRQVGFNLYVSNAPSNSSDTTAITFSIDRVKVGSKEYVTSKGDLVFSGTTILSNGTLSVGAGSGAINENISIYLTGSTDADISATGDTMVEVYYTINGANSSDDEVSFDLNELSNSYAAVVATGVDISTTFLWNDKAADTTDTDELQWFTDNEINGLDDIEKKTVY